MKVFIRREVTKIVKVFVIPVIFFFLLTLYLFQKLLFLNKARYVIAFFLNDPLLNMAILKHNMDTILSHNLGQLWQLPIFYPYKLTLAFSESLLPQSIFLLPIYSIFHYNIVVIYNYGIVFGFMGLALSSYLMYYYHTKHVKASLVASTFFAFSPFFISHINHFQVITSIWMPLIFLTMHISFVKKKINYTIIASLLYVLQSYSCVYYMIILPIFILIYYVTYFYYERDNKNFYIRSALAFISTSIAPIIILSLPYINVVNIYGFKRTIEDILPGTPTFMNFILPTPCSLLDSIIRKLLGNLQGYMSIRFYIGLIPFLTIILALVSIEKNIILRFKLNKRIMKNNTIQFTPSIIIEKHTYTPFMKSMWWIFWVSLILSLGPKILGSPLPNPIYILFYKLYPGASGIRAPVRFYALAILSGGTFISCFYKLYFSRRRTLFFFFTILLILVDFFPKKSFLRIMPYNGKVPNVYRWIKHNTQTNDKIMEFPLNEMFYGYGIQCNERALSDTNHKGFFYTFFASYHKREIFNGYSGYYTPLYIYSLVSPPKTQIQIAHTIGIKYVIIHKDMYKYIENCSKDTLEEDLIELINYLNHREQLVNVLSTYGAHKVYEDSISEVFELEKTNEDFNPDNARIESCNIQLSGVKLGDTLKIHVINNGPETCVFLYREKAKIYLFNSKGPILKTTFDLKPGNIPPFISPHHGFTISLTFHNKCKSYETLTGNMYIKNKNNKWEKIGKFEINNAKK